DSLSSFLYINFNVIFSPARCVPCCPRLQQRLFKSSCCYL
ncbi:hypothetical protein AVDCRST_MAG92-4320, partial [uncultured Coleofasciculus sp.]